MKATAKLPDITVTFLKFQTVSPISEQCSQQEWGILLCGFELLSNDFELLSDDFEHYKENFYCVTQEKFTLLISSIHELYKWIMETGSYDDLVEQLEDARTLCLEGFDLQDYERKGIAFSETKSYCTWKNLVDVYGIPGTIKMGDN